MALLGHGLWIDAEAEGFRLRVGRRGNVSDKKFLFMPQFVDVRERAALVGSATRGGCFIDIGANAGVYSLSVAKAYASLGDGKVLAVEPSASILERLRNNVTLNGFDAIVEIANVALGRCEGLVSFTISSDNLGQSGFAREEVGTRVTVPQTTLLGLLGDRRIERIDGLKIDIEGAEDAVLIPFFDEAADALLPRCVVIEDSRHTWDPALMKAFARRGYRLAEETKMNLVFSRG